MEVHANHESRQVAHPLLELFFVSSIEVAVFEVPDESEFVFGSVFCFGWIISRKGFYPNISVQQVGLGFA